MKTAYALLSMVFFAGSAIFGLFLLGSAGLAASPRAMSVAWAGWAVCLLAAAAGVVVGVRRLSLAALLTCCAVPVASAALVARVTLGFAQ
jgi:hypothetical protein